jgi:hypothetical protein
VSDIASPSVVPAASPSLLERARALVSQNRGAIAKTAALAIVPLASAVAAAQPVTMDVSSQSAGVQYAGFYEQPAPFNASWSPILNGVNITGQLGPLSGDANNAPLAYICCGNFVRFEGGILGPVQFGSRVRVKYSMTFNCTGDTSVNLNSRFMSSFSGPDFLFASDFNNSSIACGGTINGQITTVAAFNGGTEDGSWFFEVFFDWQNYTSSDTFTLVINNIDVELINNDTFGACCRGSTGNFCSITTAATCTNSFGGTYQGDNIVCRTPGTPALCCKADFNGDGTVGVQDIFDFLQAWFAGNPNANINGTNGVSPQDIFDFLALWFRGCFL